MKCSQCGNDSFFKPKDLGFDVSGDARLSWGEEFDMHRFICTKCGHVEWFELKLINELKDLNDKLTKLINELPLVESQLAKYTKEIDNLNGKLLIQDRFINDENNTVKSIKDATEDKKNTNILLQNIYRDKNYKHILDLFNHTKGKIKATEEAINKFKEKYMR